MLDELKYIGILRNEGDWLVVYLFKHDHAEYFPICFHKVRKEISETQAALTLNIAAKEEGAIVLVIQKIKEQFTLIFFAYFEDKWHIERYIPKDRIL